MYLIREARRDDIPAVLELIHQFQKESLDEYLLFCNDDKALKLMEGVWQNALVLVKRDDPAIADTIVGVIAGVIGQGMVSSDPIMQELIYFVTKEHRGQGLSLLTAFERMAKAKGCKQVLMVFMGNLHRKAMERFYTHSGYSFLEAQYIKCL